MIKERLKALQIKADVTCTEWSNLSSIPEGTIRKILSGETPDPRFDTIVKLVSSLGGSVDDIIGGKKENEIEKNAVLTLKEAYETRIEALHDRIEALKKYTEAIYRDKIFLGIAVVVLVAILVGILIFDISVGSHGWVQY